MKFIQIKNKSLSNKISKNALEDIQLYKDVCRWSFKEIADYLIYFKSRKHIKKLDGVVIDRAINLLFGLELDKER